MKKQNKTVLYLTITILFSIILSSFVLSVPPFPHSFSGTALIGSSNAASGTTATARIGGAVKGSFVMTEAGYYGNATDHKYLPVAGSSTQDLTGETITFYIGCAASNTSTWSQGSVTSLNLQIASGTAYCGDGSCNGGESVGYGDICNSTSNICQTDCGTTAAAPAKEEVEEVEGAGPTGGAFPARVPTEVTEEAVISDVILGIDPALLGLEELSAEDVIITLVQDTITETEKVSVDIINEALDLAITDEAKQALNEIKESLEKEEAISLEVKKSLTVYKVKSKTTGKSIIVTLIEAEFTAPENIINIRLIEIVPKTMAESADEVTFIGLQPTLILQADPIFEFRFDTLSEGDKKTIKYTINKKITQITSKTVASYEKEELKCPDTCDDDDPCTRDYCSAETDYKCKHDPIVPCCGNNICEAGETPENCPQDCKVEKIPWIGWVIVGIILIIGLAIYFVMKKKK